MLVCYSGKKYAEAATGLLQEMGIAAGNIYTLEGGQNGWVDGGGRIHSPHGKRGFRFRGRRRRKPQQSPPAITGKVITADQLEALMAEQEVKIFDLRDAEDYEAGHIPGR